MKMSQYLHQYCFLDTQYLHGVSTGLAMERVTYSDMTAPKDRWLLWAYGLPESSTINVINMGGRISNSTSTLWLR